MRNFSKQGRKFLLTTPLQVAALLSILAGCGSQVTAPPIGAGAAIGQQPIPQTPEQFESQCRNFGHTLISINGVTVCRKSVAPTNFYSTIPMTRIVPGQPQGGGSVGLPLVRKHDLVTIRSQGRYGLNCFFECAGATYTMDGVSSASGSVVIVNSLPAGLMVSDGTTTHFAGNGVRVRISNDGILRFGINSAFAGNPSSTPTGTPMIIGATIERCEDISGQTYECP